MLKIEFDLFSCECQFISELWLDKYAKQNYKATFVFKTYSKMDFKQLNFIFHMLSFGVVSLSRLGLK